MKRMAEILDYEREEYLRPANCFIKVFMIT